MRRFNDSQKLGLMFCAPMIVGLLGLTLYPVLASLWYSLCDYPVFTAPRYIGLENYREVARDPIVWLSVRNTLFFTVVGVPLGLIVAFLLALLLNAKVRFQAIFRTIFFIPSMVPFVAGAVLWLWLLNPQYGIFNQLLGHLGIAPIGWLVDPKWSKPSLVLMGLWGVGGSMVIYLAALQDVPQVLYEAADMDGAGFFWKLVHIVIPTVSPITLYLLLMGIIGSLQYFTQPLIMTGGGPVDSTMVYALHLFMQAFMQFRMGYASALAWLLFIVSIVLSLIVLRVSRQYVHYGEDS